jgi:hypothetical protein
MAPICVVFGITLAMMKVQGFRLPLNSGLNYSQPERSIFLQGKFIRKRNEGNKD